MPIYEYSCPKCGEFEVTQRITEDPLKRCPTCRSKVRKLISSTSFQLKGSGWYVTDYAKKGAGKDAAKESGGSTGDGGETTAGKTADSKTADSKTADSKTADSKTADSKTTASTSDSAKSTKKDTAAKAA